MRARSRHELAEKLRGKDVPHEVAEPLLDRFTEVGLIDDAAFAQSWVEQRSRTKGLGRRALVQELRLKGVDQVHIEAALAEIGADEEREAARALAEKRLRTLSRLDPPVQRRRLEGFLARKGYPGSLVSEVVREALEQQVTDE
ncbi:recombination regulator RecX [Nocardioidaceae bacterium]|nr:recombination regulator RecX [Nocardioidaceae bacterium]